MPSSQKMAMVGLFVSLYAVYVEYKMKTKSDTEDFVALCDVEQIGASCSAVFELPEGHLLSYFGLVKRHSDFDIPNALIGCVYYMYMLFLSSYFPLALTKVAVTMAFVTTVFLAYQLTFVVPELCIVCWTTHVLNTLLWYNVMFGGQTKSRANKQKTA